MIPPPWAYASSESSPAVVHISTPGWIPWRRSYSSESLSRLSALLSVHRANLASASPPSTKASKTYRHLYKAIFSNRGHLGCDAISAFAAPKSTTATLPAFPGTLANAQYVYVAAYDGDQFYPLATPNRAYSESPKVVRGQN